MYYSSTQLKKFIKAVKAFLKEMDDMPATELAEILQLKPRTVQSWLAGNSRPALESIEDFTVKMKGFQRETDKATAALDAFFQAV